MAAATAAALVWLGRDLIRQSERGPDEGERNWCMGARWAYGDVLEPRKSKTRQGDPLVPCRVLEGPAMRSLGSRVCMPWTKTQSGSRAKIERLEYEIPPSGPCWNMSEMLVAS